MLIVSVDMSEIVTFDSGWGQYPFNIAPSCNDETRKLNLATKALGSYMVRGFVGKYRIGPKHPSGFVVP